MSLSDFAFNHGQFMDKYFYACSRYNVDVIPIEERRHVTVGILCITYGVLCEMLYLPCLWAIYQQIKRNRSATCYIFMFYLGIVDTAGIVVTAFIAGIQSIQGVVYCQSPVVNYVFVFVELFGWFAANTTTLILAINRCMVIYDDDVANKFFKGRRGTMWLIVPTIVGILGICLSPPLFFDPIDTGAVYNPHKHYLPDDDFCPSAALVTYNWFIVIAVPAIYFLFAAFLIIRFRDGGITPSSEFSTFLQVLITSIFVMLTSIGLIYQERLKYWPLLVYVGYMIYQGSPAFIYLCMNRSIRNTLLPRTNRVYQSTHIPGEQNATMKSQVTPIEMRKI